MATVHDRLHGPWVDEIGYYEARTPMMTRIQVLLLDLVNKGVTWLRRQGPIKLLQLIGAKVVELVIKPATKPYLDIAKDQYTSLVDIAKDRYAAWKSDGRPVSKAEEFDRGESRRAIGVSANYYAQRAMTTAEPQSNPRRLAS